MNRTLGIRAADGKGKNRFVWCAVFGHLCGSVSQDRKSIVAPLAVAEAFNLKTEVESHDTLWKITDYTD